MHTKNGNKSKPLRGSSSLSLIILFLRSIRGTVVFNQPDKSQIRFKRNGIQTPDAFPIYFEHCAYLNSSSRKLFIIPVSPYLKILNPFVSLKSILIAAFYYL